MKVALLQLVSYGTDQDSNLAKGEFFCRQAAAMGADITLFPEMWSIGYTFSNTPEGRALLERQAIDQNSIFVKHFRALAKELNMAIALTYLEKCSGAPRNTVSLINRHGDIVLTYAKVHTCDFGDEAALTPGEDFYVCALDTAEGEVKIGAMICYDREFPESARILMLKGAEIILTPNACDLEANRLGQFRARAYENMVGVAMANYAAPQFNGHSVAYHPMAFDENERSRDTLIVEAGEREGIYLADFDLATIRDWRERETWGNAYRRPRCYDVLVSPDVQEPFIRSDSKK